jgi:hypothetical protein
VLRVRDDEDSTVGREKRARRLPPLRSRFERTEETPERLPVRMDPTGEAEEDVEVEVVVGTAVLVV